jgi:hypothetical protein
VASLYGTPISDAERSELLRRLRQRNTTESVHAASTIAKSAHKDATPETAGMARKAILFELERWPGLDETCPRLASVRDRLSNPAQATRII